MKQVNKEKVIKRRLFLGVIIISILVTLVYLGLVNFNSERNSKEDASLTVDEVKSYTSEEYQKDTFNVDFDKLSDKEKKKIDNINAIKLNLYELNQDRVQKDIFKLLKVDTEDDNSKARLDLKMDNYFYDNYMSNYEEYKIPDLEELDIDYAGVCFDNDVVCKYFVICSAISGNGNQLDVLKINIGYTKGVLTSFTVNK